MMVYIHAFDGICMCVQLCFMMGGKFYTVLGYRTSEIFYTLYGRCLFGLQHSLLL